MRYIVQMLHVCILYRVSIVSLSVYRLQHCVNTVLCGASLDVGCFLWRRRKKKCIRYMGEDGGGSVDGDDDDDSSRMGSHVSTCDTDSLQDMEVDSPHHSTLHHPHSPLSPIVSGEAGVEDRRREMKMVVDTTSRMGLDSGLESFPRCKIQDTSLPLSSVPFSGSIMSSPLPNFVQGDTRAVSYTPVKGGHCDSVTTHCSPQVVAT